MPITAVRPSSSGTPAAISAPKATTRISSVIGSESVSARWKSFSNCALSALAAEASPNCSMRSSGCAFCAAATAASEESTRSSDSSMSPGTLKVTSAERPSLEIWPSLPLANGDSTSRHVLGRGELGGDVVDRGAERRVCSLAVALGLDEHRLRGLLGERVGAGLVGDARGAVALLLGSEGLGADHAADDERDRDEREPSEDGGLAVLCGPAPCAGREVGVGQFACLPVLGGHGSKRAARGARRHWWGLASPGAGFLTPHPEAPSCGILLL